MALTPNSNSTSYLSVGDFLTFHDYRAVGQLSNDSNYQPLYSELIDPLTIYYQYIYQILLAASGRLESSALIGERYQPADLRNLNGASQAFLKEIVSSLAMMGMYKRRDGPIPPQGIVDDYKNAEDMLEKLRKGDALFAFAEDEAAGIPSSSIMTPQDYVNAKYLTSQTRWAGTRQSMKWYGGI